jgi:glycosyltransferase involved in cell wall biosynthesis
MAVILYAHPGAELYGSDRMALETVVVLTEGGHDVRVVLPTEGPLADRLRDRGIPVIILAVPALRKSLLHPTQFPSFIWNTFMSTRRAVRLIRSTSASVVFVNTIIQPVWICAGRIARRRVICHVREAEKQLNGGIQRLLVLPVGFAHTVIANSISTLEAFQKHTTFRPRQTVVVYNGKDWDEYFGGKPRAMPLAPHLVVVGRLGPRKGQDLVVRALAILANESRRPTLSFVGDTFPGYEWYKEELELLIVNSGLSEQCEFVGFSAEIGTHLSAADIVIVPSREEPFGTVAAEAMASMRPTIVSNTGGLPEIVSDHQTGLLVECGDVGDIARAVRELMEDPDLAQGLAEAGYHSVRERFSAEEYAREMSRIVAMEVAQGKPA